MTDRTANRPLPDRYGNSSEYQEKRALLFRAREKDFSTWLAASGATIRTPCSEYEVIRYTAWDAGQAGSAKRPATHVVYRKVDGRVTFTGHAARHFSLFIAGEPFPDQSRSKDVAKKATRVRNGDEAPKLTWARKTRDICRGRDGDDCWFCGKPAPELPIRSETNLSRAQYADLRPTVEHMLAKHLGGDNHIDNLVLAHGKCNRDVGHRTPEEKRAVRDMIRAGLVTSVAHWIMENPSINPPPRKRKAP